MRFSLEGPAAGRLASRQRSATCLGTVLTDTFDHKADMANQLGDSIKSFCAKDSTSFELKILVLNAIIILDLFKGG